MTVHHYTETATPDATKRYPSDLNGRQFDLVAPHVAQKAGSEQSFGAGNMADRFSV
jgi:hypothetical protein